MASRLGAIPPLTLARAYVAVLIVPMLLRRVLERQHASVLATLALALWALAMLALFCIVTWARDDDALESGVLLGLTVGLGWVAAQVVATVLMSSSVGAGALLFMTTLLPTLILLVVLIPLSAGAVWVARRATRLLLAGARALRRERPAV